MSIQVDKVLDAKGLSCPMPIVRTKKAIEDMDSGQVLEIQATDKGSLADIQGWAKNTGHQYLGTKEEGEVLHHYIRKRDPRESKLEQSFSHVVNNEELAAKLNQDEPITVLDVREPAEYAFAHIPQSISIPYGELESRLTELDKNKEIYVICRTGNRSDMAAQLLEEKGFEKVKNVVPGMSEWNGPIIKA